jgi:hypothetical protein
MKWERTLEMLLRRQKKAARPKKKNRAAPKRRRKPTRKRLRALPTAVGAFARLATHNVKGSVRVSPDYWKMPIASRLAFVRKMRKGSARDRRAAVLIAKAELARAEGPPRRSNPGMNDAEARDEYTRTHWGERGKGRVKAGRAAAPDHGTLAKMGRLVSVVYETKKGGDRGLTQYEHEFEGKRPTLAYNDGGLVIVGGSYKIAEGGIDG